MIEATLQGTDPYPPDPITRNGSLQCHNYLLGVWRTIVLCIMFAAASMDYLLRGSGLSLRKRSHWLHRWSRRCARLIGMHFARNGTVPRTGLIVANHLSYLDIIALSATGPSLFVAKSDVSRWPVFGAFARMAGTIFIDRNRRLNVARTAAELKSALETGLPVVVFPEGTSSDGRNVLPFKSSLLQPACDGTIPVTPVAIRYTIAGGSAGDLVCYWGNMTLVPHLLKLLTVREFSVSLAFGSPDHRKFHRKDLAVRLRQEIIAMRDLYAPGFTMRKLSTINYVPAGNRSKCSPLTFRDATALPTSRISSMCSTESNF